MHEFYRYLHGRAGGYAGNTQYPGVTNSVARCHLGWFGTEAQYANLTHVTVAVAHPNVPGALAIG